MPILIGLIVGVICLVLVVLPAIYFQSRKVLREQKNYERGLKMVTLIIHLPPPSDDTDVGSRDARDVIDETISKSQTIYSILASSFEKSFRRQFYGQRHVTFEMVCHAGFVKFYTVVPVSLVELIKQAVISAYPSATLEEVPDHNIFNKVGRINATVGGELTLKENFAYSIATYQDLKRDPLKSILNALSSLDKQDGAAIQILLRPAKVGWAKEANEFANKKRKGQDKKKGSAVAFWWISQIFEALFKPPEDKGDSGPPGSNLSGHEQAILDSIDEKTRHPGFETSIRIITSSNVAQRAQTLQKNLVASFALFDAQGRNGFKYTPAVDIEQFATAYIMRFFPQKSTSNILNSVELATLFHFPQQEDIPTSQLTRQDSKQVDGPRNVPDTGLLMGYNIFRGIKKPIRLALEDRQRHVYVVGQTGTGKSTFLENLAVQDMLMGNGFAFIDPHGDTAEKLLSMVPKERTEDVIYFCPADTDYPLGLNVFEAENDDQKDFVIQEVLNMLHKLYDPNNQGIMGPRYDHIFRNAALTVMAGPDGGSFIDIPKLFRDKDYVNQKLKYVKDNNVVEFWQKEMVQAQRSNEFGDVVNWFVSKFGAFLSNGTMRNIIGQTKSSFDLREIMDNKKILLVNLSKGRTGELNSNLLGMMFVMKFQAAALSRANVPENDRVDFCLYVDEFQNFSTESFATILSEARKFRLNLIVANQFTTQLTEEIRAAVFGNVGTIVAFRVGQDDVDPLTRYFQPTFDSEDLLRIPNRNTVVRTLIGGVPTQPFSMATIAPLGTPNSELGDALKQLSATKYARPRQVIEKEIFERMSVKEPTKPATAGGYGRPAAGTAANPYANRFGASQAAGLPQNSSLTGRGQSQRPVYGAGAQTAYPPGYAPALGNNVAGTAQASAYRGAQAANMPITPTPAASPSFLDQWMQKKGQSQMARPAGQMSSSPQPKQFTQTQPVSNSPLPNVVSNDNSNDSSNDEGVLHIPR